MIDLMEQGLGSRQRSLIFFTVAQQGDATALAVADAIASQHIAHFDQLYAVVTELLTHAIIAAQAQ